MKPYQMNTFDMQSIVLFENIDIRAQVDLFYA